MNLTEGLHAARRAVLLWRTLILFLSATALMTNAVRAQGVGTTTVEGTVYLADGRAGSGTLLARWPAFTTAAGQAVAAGSLTAKIPADGFVSVNLAPNLGSTPAGEYYTVVLYLSDGSTSTEYWVVPAAATATLAQVRAQVMPAAQAVQAVSKAYVDQAISQLTQSLLTASGGNLSGPLYLSGDPTQALQAADKHYVDGAASAAANAAIANALPGVTVTGNGDVQLNGSLKVGDVSSLYASFTGRNSIAFPGLAAASGRNCLQIDAMGNITNTGTACSSGSGTVNAGSNGQIAYYTGDGTAVGGTSAVPVTAGGTGASSAAAALANLGALPTSGGSLSGSLSGTDAAFSGQVKAAAISGDVNGVFSVTTYGAKGDCTGSGSTASCTDNTSAIQTAINAAYAAGGSVYLPTNPSAGGQTVYYIANAVNPKGVSIYGPPGGYGPNGYYPSALPVAIRGAQGKDVFRVTDPLDGGFVDPHLSFVVRDFAVIVDNTVDASASFPYRKPGRTCADVSTTSGSPVISSANQCIFQPGDVGQALTVGSLTTTVLSYQSTSQVTLAANAASTASNVSTYISLADLPVTMTVGNCAFAFEDRSGSALPISQDASVFENLNITTPGNSPGSNKTCGFFYQGNAATYKNTWRNLYVQQNFPFLYVPQNTSTPTAAMLSGLGDFNQWDHVWMSGAYPFISYSGSDSSLKDIQLSNVYYGPHILRAFGQGSTTPHWYIDIPESETVNATCGSHDISFRISGYGHTVDRLSVHPCVNNTEWFQWDADSSSVRSLSIVSAVSHANIAGSLNTFYVDNTSNIPSNYSITGTGNVFKTGRASNPYNGVPIQRNQYVGGSGTTFGPPQLSRGAVAFERTHDFIEKGAVNSFFNSEDLWFWPNELYGVTAPPTVTDANSETGMAIYQAGGLSQLGLFISNGTALVIGKQVPATKIRVYYKEYATVNNGWTSAGINYSATPGGSATSAGSCNFQLSTSYTVKYCDADLSGLSGQYLQLRLGGYGFPVSGTDVYTAWVGIKVWDSDTTTTSLALGQTGVAMTANHGDGTSVQHSDGTGTSAPAFFDANGNVTGTAAGALGAGNGGTGTTALTGVRYANGGSADTAATGAQVAAAIGSTAVANASNSANVANTGAQTTNASYYLCYLAANTTSNQACNSGGIIYNPSSGNFQLNMGSGYFVMKDSTGTNNRFSVDGNGNLTTYGSSGINASNGTNNFQIQNMGNSFGLFTANQGIVFRHAGGTQNMLYGANGNLWVGSGNGVYSNPSYLLTIGTAGSYGFDNSGNATVNAVTASGLVTGGNDSTRTTSTTMTNAWTTTGLVLPSVPASKTKTGHCTIYWQMSSTSYTATFGLGMDNAPTNVWGGTRVISAAAGTQNWLAFTQSATATTAISTAATAGVAATTYEALMDFTIQAGATNPVTMTIYGQTSNSGGTLTIMPGSTCYWLP